MGLQSPLNLSDEELAAAMQLKCTFGKEKSCLSHERQVFLPNLLPPTVACGTTSYCSLYIFMAAGPGPDTKCFGFTVTNFRAKIGAKLLELNNNASRTSMSYSMHFASLSF